MGKAGRDCRRASAADVVLDVVGAELVALDLVEPPAPVAAKLDGRDPAFTREPEQCGTSAPADASCCRPAVGRSRRLLRVELAAAPRVEPFPLLVGGVARVVDVAVWVRVWNWQGLRRGCARDAGTRIACRRRRHPGRGLERAGGGGGASSGLALPWPGLAQHEPASGQRLERAPALLHRDGRPVCSDTSVVVASPAASWLSTFRRTAWTHPSPCLSSREPGPPLLDRSIAKHPASGPQGRRARVVHDHLRGSAEDGGFMPHLRFRRLRSWRRISSIASRLAASVSPASANASMSSSATTACRTSAASTSGGSASACTVPLPSTHAERLSRAFAWCGRQLVALDLLGVRRRRA